MSENMINESARLYQGPWWEQFGLNTDPFASLAVTRESVYIPKEWEQYIDLMQLLTRHSNELVIITGNKGVGKTTLVEQFLEQLDDSVAVCRLNGRSTLDAEEFIQSIAGCFSLPYEREYGASIRVQLNSLLNHIIQNEEQCLFLVDDAHELSAPIIQAILYLQAQRWEQQAPLAIMLVIDKSFEERFYQIGESYIERSMIKTLALSPLDLNNTEAYLEQRFVASGLRNELPLSREDVIHIHQWSGGVAGRVNNVTKQLLLDKLEQQNVGSTVSFWELHRSKVIGSLILFLMSSMAIYFWQNHQISAEPTTVASVKTDNTGANELLADNNKVAEQSAATATSQTAVAAEQQAPLTTSADEMTPSSAPDNTQAAVDQKSTTAIAEQAATSAPTTTSERNDAVTQVTAKPRIEVPPHPPVAAAATDTADDSVDQPTTATNNMGDAAPLAEVSAVPAKAQTAAVANNLPQTTTVAQAKSESKLAAKPVSAATSHNAHNRVAANNKPRLSTSQGSMAQLAKAHGKKLQLTMTAARKLSKHERYLLTQPAHEYTVQIIGLSHVEALQRFVAQQKLGSQARYYRTKLHGKDWYVLVYGRYKSMVEAQAAIKKLTPVVRQQNPWIRSFASVHQSIHHND